MDSTQVFPADSLPVTERTYRRFSVAEYEDMIRSGIIKEDDNVELLEGWIVEKMTKNAPHSDVTQFLRDWLPGVVPSGYLVRDQEPVMTSDSEPEPDLVILRGTRQDFVKRKPAAQEVALAIEVAESSLRDDRVWKLRIFAGAGIPVYWIVNLVEGNVEVYTDPYTDEIKSAYREQKIYGEKDAIPVVIDGKEVGRLAVAELLP